VKPCTQTEISFYEAAIEHHPDLASLMPTFLGTLSQATTISAPIQVHPAELSNVHNQPTQAPTTTAAGAEDEQQRTKPDTTHLKGRPISSPLHIVLSSITTGLHRPNVLDLKLGSRLWDDTALPAKRARLDAVAQSTTSGSLGFRVAGMRVWEGHNQLYADEAENAEMHDGDDGNNDGNDNDDNEDYLPGKPHRHSALHGPSNCRFYNKLFGRTLTPGRSVKEGLKRFVVVPGAGIDVGIASELLRVFCEEVREIREVLERTEMRMFSGSILIAYEGDGEAFRAREKELARLAEGHENGKLLQNGNGHGNGEVEEEDNDDDDDDDLEPPVLYRVKLIDFAHSRFTPGLGVDENVLQGVRSIEKIFGEMYEELLAEEK
jgi:inositol-polyphosphate multikinase